MPGQKLVPALQKAMEILFLLAASGEHDVGVSEIATRFSFSKGTTYGILQTLVHYQIVEQDTHTGRYRLGVRIAELAAARQGNGADVSAFYEVAEDLKLVCKENINYSVLRGDYNYVLAAVPADDHVLQVDLPMGSTVPVMASSAGKVLAGDLDERALSRMFDRQQSSFTRNTIVSREEFIRQVRDARQKGYAVNNAEYEDGIFSVAAPVKNAGGQVIAAVNIVMPASRYSERVEQETIELVKRGARQIGKRLCGVNKA